MRKVVDFVVVPGYYLVCYNLFFTYTFTGKVVVPGYYLVCYNKGIDVNALKVVVVPGYYLVCYNLQQRSV